MHCNANGVPTPNRTWLFKSNTADDNVDFTSLHWHEDTLEIEAFKPDHEGLYACEATNGIRNQTARNELTLRGVAAGKTIPTMCLETKLICFVFYALCICDICLKLINIIVHAGYIVISNGGSVKNL